MKVGLIILISVRNTILTEMLFSAEKACAEVEATLTENLLGLVTGCDVDIDVWIAVFWFADRPRFFWSPRCRDRMMRHWRSPYFAVSFFSLATGSCIFPTQTQSSLLTSFHHRALVVSISRDESRPHHPEHFEKQDFDGNAVLGGKKRVQKSRRR